MRTICFILVFACLTAVQAQVKVITYSHIPSSAAGLCRPDVEGYVLVNGDINNIGTTADSIFPYPSWPIVTVPGNQKLGGICVNIYGDESAEILFTAGQKVYAWTLDGTIVPGWPQNLSLYPDGPPAFGDIDNDGIGEIVVSTRSSGTANQGKLYAYRQNGTLVPGFPVTLGGGPTNTPCLADINGDGALEILVTERNYPNGYVAAYNGSGTLLPGWPQTMDYIPGSAVSAADIDNDGVCEVFAESYYQVWGWKADGSVLPGWPYLPGTDRVFSYSTPVIADLDQDGSKEVIVGDHSLNQGNGKVHVIKTDGTALTGWPQTMNYWIYSPCSIGDIDGDDNWDLATGDQVLSGTPVNELSAWNYSGQAITGFPVTGLEAINVQPLICNLDNDNDVEIMIDDNTTSGLFHVFNHDGTPLLGQGYPLQVTGQSFYINPFAGDINHDNMLEIVTAGYTSASLQTSVHVFGSNFPWMPDLAYTSMLGFNLAHDGLFGSPGTVGITSQYNSEGDLVVYPNPASDKIVVSLKELKIKVDDILSVSDFMGREIIRKTIEPGEGELHLSIDKLKAGLYFILLTQENSPVTSKIFVVQ